MIIIPAEQTLDWRRPPVATLALIIINCLVFFVYQLGDGQRLAGATQYYLDSVLLDREAPLFLKFIETHRELPVISATRTLVDKYGNAALASQIVESIDFSHFIKEEVVNGNLDEEFWDENRQVFTELQHEYSGFAYGFIPADFKISGLFGAMFLHGGFAHLLGNMLFLFICGFALEVAFGRWWFLGLYLLSGCLSHLFWYAMNLDSYIFLVGASGAISGLMGMYAALYGKTQIKFFYWLFFFFGYFRAPALLVFPIWVGNEIFGALTAGSGGGGVAYYAHLGGLISGFCLVFFCKDKILRVDKSYVEKEASEDDLLLEKCQEMWDYAGQFKLDKAWVMGQELLEANENNQHILRRIYNVAKANPKGKRYHKITHQIVTAESNDESFIYFKVNILKDYLEFASEPKALTEQVCLDLIRPICVAGFDSESYCISQRLMYFYTVNENPQAEEICKALFRVLMQQLKLQKQTETSNLLKFLQEKFPDAEETSMALESIALATK